MNRKHRWVNIWYVFIALLLICMLFVPIIDEFNLKLTDNLYNTECNNKDIVILDIDDFSINQIGAWPWNRDVFAEVVEKTKNAKITAIDVSFLESREGDEELDKALKENNAVVVGEIIDNKKHLPIVGDKYAISNVISDVDGKVRKYPSYVSGEKTLATYMYNKITDSSLKNNNTFLINYCGRPNSFVHYSFYDVYNDSINKSAWNNKIVFIGATAMNLHDFYITPTSISPMHGVEIHANALYTMLSNNYLSYQSIQSTALIIILLVIIIWLISKYSTIYSLVFSITATIILLFITAYLFIYNNYIVNLLHILISIWISFFAAITIKYFVETKEKQKIKNMFEKYVSPKVIEHLIKNPEKIKLGGEEREVSIMFSDVRGFTSIAEHHSPHELVEIINTYLDIMSDTILEHDGVVDKYIGDAIMAFWGAPLAQPQNADLAVNNAIDMIKKLPSVRSQTKEKGFDIGIGINTGKAVIGNMGSHKRFDYTLLGDAVNLASRLEGINKVYGTKIIISDYTKKKLKENFILRKLDKIVVKGKTQPVIIYEVIGREDQKTKVWSAIIHDFEKGLKYYFDGKFKKAIEFFKKHKDDYPSKVFIERCELLIKQKPKEWDGIWRLKEK